MTTSSVNRIFVFLEHVYTSLMFLFEHTTNRSKYFYFLVAVLGKDIAKSGCLKKFFGCFYNTSKHKCFCKTKRACVTPFKYKNEHQCMKAISKVKGETFDRSAKYHYCVFQLDISKRNRLFVVVCRRD